MPSVMFEGPISPPAPPTTRMAPGPRLVLARIAWALLACLAVGLFCASLPARYNQLRAVGRDNLVALAQFGLSDVALARYIVALDIATLAGCAAIALVIVWRRSDDWMALFVALMLLIYGVWNTRPVDALQALPASLRWPVDSVRALGQGLTLLFGYLFPDGRFVPRWTRPAAFIWVGLTLAWLLVPTLPLNLLTTTGSGLPASLVFAAWLATGLSAQIYRYLRVSTRLERQQTKWIVFGAAGAVLGFVTFIGLGLVVAAFRQPGLPRLLYICTGVPCFYLATLLLPFSIGVSMLRYRLWEIDVIINRALVYGLLTVALGTLYIGGVVLLQNGFRAITGEPSPVAVVTSTLAIAALFQPVRRQIQNGIDRRFYRRKYDAAKTLQAFSTQIRDETDLDALTAALRAVVMETMQPDHVSIWLREEAATFLNPGQGYRDTGYHTHANDRGHTYRERRSS